MMFQESTVHAGEACPSCGVILDVSRQPLFSVVCCPQCGSEIRIRDRVGSYQLLGQLGEGGSGKVFLARRLVAESASKKPHLLGQVMTWCGKGGDHNPQVALKVLEPEIPDYGEHLALLRNEAECSGRIRSSKVVRTLGFEEDAEGARIAMELMPGGSLHDMIVAKRTLDEERVLSTGLNILQALEAAYDQRILHRDLKPANILFDAKGGAKLSDFGLAGSIPRKKRGAQDLHATPDYVAPEVLAGSAWDFRSDLYGLGGCLFHGLTGYPPYATEGLGLEQLRAVKSRPVKIPPMRTDVSPITLALVNRMMEPDPDRRFKSHREMRAAFLKARNNLPPSRRRA